MNGYALKGADNNGMCYYIKEIPYKIKEKLEISGIAPEDWQDNERTVETIDENRYYDDPVLTFEDATVFGCTLELNLQELEDFCLKSKWQHLMIFQNLLQLELVGSSGNANPRWEKDWLQIDIDGEEQDAFTVQADWEA